MTKQLMNQAGLDTDRLIFLISVVADQIQVHQRTLRIWDDKGILQPKRSQKNRRLYSFNDLEKGKLIQYMTRELGINLAGIKIIFGMLNAPLELKPCIEDIKYIAESLKITPEQQEESRIKLSRRGRKPNPERVNDDQ